LLIPWPWVILQEEEGFKGSFKAAKGYILFPKRSQKGLKVFGNELVVFKIGGKPMESVDSFFNR
jgi:hypothetical protein